MTIMDPRHIALGLALCVVAAASARATDAAELWSSRVQRLLDVHCVKCHGPLEQKSGLELDTPEAILKGGDEGAVIIPGDPEKSRLYSYLAAESDPHMPPKKQLTDTERGAIRDWIVALTVQPTPAPPETASAERSFASVAQAIDTFIGEAWAELGIQPAKPVDDRTWVRRVHLDLLGRIPTAEEVARFLASAEDSSVKRAALVDALLESEAYAVRMRELWDVFLMGRAKRENHEARRREKGWWTFLENAFRSDQPWSETVRAMLVARPDSDTTRGASWFLYERRDDHQAIAEAVSPVVYGTKIDCAQCHDHPLAREIKQAHYWGLVAAFNRSKNVAGGSDVAESAVGGFVNFTNLKKESQPALITLLNGRILDEPRPAGDEKEVDQDDKYVDPKAKVRVPRYSRRESFASAVTHDNPLLARAFVNRMWAVFLGRGLVHPADEMNERNAPSHPELLAWLSQDFAAHDYNIRRLIRGMVLSRPYGLGPSKASPSPASFAAALERPLMAEQIARSWRVAMGLAPEDEPLRRAVITAFPEVLPGEYTATFQQAQFLANSPLLANLLNAGAGSEPERLAGIPDPAARVREAFRAVYGREPDDDEASHALSFVEARADRPAAGVRDLLWALMNSAEFLLMP